MSNNTKKKNLLIVESPTKARTINQYLGKKFLVKATMGHVKDLPKSKFGVDIDEKGFSAHYITMKGKQKVLKELKTLARQAERIYLAPDPDREGEAIAYHVQTELLKVVDKPEVIGRAIFSEITSEAVKESLESSGPVDMDKVYAQQTRRILDRIVGYKISPLLWKALKTGLSAGRVQSVALRLICDREHEIQAFEPREYWTMEGIFKAAQSKTFSARLFKIDGKDPQIPDEKSAREHRQAIESRSYNVTNIDKKNRKRHPYPPFITSTLQQEAARRFRFSAQKTMFIAQQLYEGVSLGKEGMEGLITYMRTDSTRVSQKAIQGARQYIKDRIGDQYLPSSPRFYRKKKGAQDAHEAIRPTDPVAHPPENVTPYLNKEQLKLYTLIFERFIASQMKPAVYDQTTVDIINKPYHFRATGNILRFEGFLKVYKTKEDTSQKESKELPEITTSQELELARVNPEQHFTKPPPRYTEAALIKTLEEKEVGRPSTYAAIVATIQQRHYVAREKGSFYPTELGLLVNDLLIKFFPDIVDVQFTAKMEDELDKVEEGAQDSNKLLQDFYKKFTGYLQHAEKGIKKALQTDISCDLCGKPMAIRVSKSGRHFLGCTAYPECKNLKEFTLLPSGKIKFKEPEEEKEVDVMCDKCGSQMVVKHSRYGKFLACSAYPDCSYTRSLNGKKKETRTLTCKKCSKPMDIFQSPHGNDYAVCQDCKVGFPFYARNEYRYPQLDIRCDKCSAKMIVRKKRKNGDRFLGCERFPKCRNIKPFDTGIPCGDKGTFLEKRIKGRVAYQCSENTKITLFGKVPVAKKCPDCKSLYLVEMYLASDNKAVEKCPQKGCSYEKVLTLIPQTEKEESLS